MKTNKEIKYQSNSQIYIKKIRSSEGYSSTIYRVSQKKGNPTLARYCACISS